MSAIALFWDLGSFHGKIMASLLSTNFKEENWLNFSGSLILRDMRAWHRQFRVWVISTLFLSEKGMR